MLWCLRIFICPFGCDEGTPVRFLQVKFGVIFQTADAITRHQFLSVTGNCLQLIGHIWSGNHALSPEQ